MPKTEERTLTQLLDEWAELGGEECEAFAEGWRVLFNGSEHMILMDMQSDPAIIQAAVQEAIEQRGWKWDVGTYYNDNQANYIAGIRLGPPVADGDIVDGMAASPAHALLTAYLKALRTHD